MPWGPTQTMSFDARFIFNTAGSDLPCNIVRLWFCLCRCTETAQRAVYGAHTVKYVTWLYFCLCFYIMSPSLLCKSSIQSGNSEQCTLAFTHLFVLQLHPLLCTISYLCMCLLYMHKSSGIASSIVSVSSLIQVLSSIVCILFMVQLVLLYSVYPINVSSLYLNSTMIHLYTNVKVNDDWEANHMSSMYTNLPLIVGGLMGGGYKTFGLKY